MRVSVSDAKGQLTELVKRTEAGDKVILTRHGHEIVRLVAVAAASGSKDRRTLMERVRAAAAKALPGLDGGRSTWLRSWAAQVAKRRGAKRAMVALARRIGTILHRMWKDGTEFSFVPLLAKSA